MALTREAHQVKLAVPGTFPGVSEVLDHSHGCVPDVFVLVPFCGIFAIMLIVLSNINPTFT